MSPEQAQGAPLDARSDLYSLGVLFYQMLAGRAPFVDDDAVVVMARHIKDIPPPFSEVALDAEVPASVERVLRRSLMKSPNDRMQNAEEFIAELDAALESAGSVASGVHTASVTDLAPPPRRRIWMVVAAVIVVALVGGSIWAASKLRHAAGPAEQPISAEAAPAAVGLAPTATTSGSTLPSGENSGNPVATSTSRVKESRSTAPEGSTVVPRKATQRRSAPAGAPTLERKGNERYGRFE
jgi:serine/threonine-protein kinase